MNVIQPLYIRLLLSRLPSKSPANNSDRAIISHCALPNNDMLMAVSMTYTHRSIINRQN